MSQVAKSNTHRLQKFKARVEVYFEIIHDINQFIFIVYLKLYLVLNT